jgi:low temperature requirement protein LtrA
VAEATGKHATAFVLSYVAIRVLLLVQYARAYRHVEAARGGIRIYLCGTGAGAACGSRRWRSTGPARYGLWALGLLVDAAAPLLVTASRTQVPLHLEHLPDRFSLFVILVLGSPSPPWRTACTTPRGPWGRSSRARCASSSPAALWWSYFDLAGAGAKHLLEEAGGRSSTVSHDVYVYGQLPLCLALVAVGAASRAWCSRASRRSVTGCGRCWPAASRSTS